MQLLRSVGAVGLLMLVAGPFTTLRAQSDPVSPGRVEPRLAALEAWPDGAGDAVAALAVPGSSSVPLARLLAHSPAALEALAPQARHVRDAAMAPAFDQALMALRVAWRSGSPLAWAEYADRARALGLSEADVRRVSREELSGWGRWDATILAAADALSRDDAFPDVAWARLAERYNARQLLELLLTAGDALVRSVASRTLGASVAPEPEVGWPGATPSTTAPPAGRTSWAPRLHEVSMEVPDDRGMEAWRRTVAVDARVADVVEAQLRFLHGGSSLAPRLTDLVVLRTAWLSVSPYLWSHHADPVGRAGLTADEAEAVTRGPRAPGWTASEAALLEAVDQLYVTGTVAPFVWNHLASQHDAERLVDLVVTASLARSMAWLLNSVAPALEPGRAGFPSR